ncbi:MAG: Na-K-Cl cotransporter [Bdellovibrionales bacterium]
MDSADSNKFGTFKGVFVPSILTILGVILFLRLGWVVGQAGLVSALFIITLSSLITFITGLSISSAATNTKVGPGGSYFLVSRCFGLEPGAAIGLPLYFAQALGISFYVVGFAESLALFFPQIPVTYVAFGTLVLLTILTFTSSALALKSQVFILGLITLALLSFIFGTPIETDPSVASTRVIVPEGFWTVFAVFFPAVTGIEAGISMSGDLKDPRKSLPVGTLSAVLVGYVCYIIFAIKFDQAASAEMLIDNSLIMTEVALVGILIFLGLWGATLSSTLGALLGAPRTMQALAKDRILPGFLAQGTKETNEPQYATIASFVVAGCGILIGDLNAIAAILSMFFLTSYGALNLVSGLEGMLANPSWRPTFKIPWVVSMVGAFLCFGAMFMIDSGASFIAIGLVILVYFIMKKRGIRSNYSDIRGGIVLHFIRELIYKLEDVKKDERNWRPNFLIFSGSPRARLYLIDLAYAISKKRGFMTVASVVAEPGQDQKRVYDLERASKEFLKKKRIQSLAKFTQASSFHEGAKALIKNYGVGRLVPNTVVLGDSQSMKMEYAEVACEVVNLKKNLIVVKTSPDFDESKEFRGQAVDIWWRGKEGNLGLMLTLAYMLTSSDKWRYAKLTLKSIAQTEEERRGVIESMSNFVKESRVPAEIEVYTREGDAFVQMRASSKNADLVLLGLEKPSSPEEFIEYYQQITPKLEGFPSTALILKGEDFNFKEIFS